MEKMIVLKIKKSVTHNMQRLLLLHVLQIRGVMSLHWN